MRECVECLCVSAHVTTESYTPLEDADSRGILCVVCVCVGVCTFVYRYVFVSVCVLCTRA